jgi:ABC-2 type transport system ATP-binding protein
MTCVPAIELDRVVKRFGEKVAVDELSLTLPRGSFLGLLGRNGAGKSTTLKMLTGLVRPSSGRVRILGMDVEEEPLAVKRRIGVMPEDMALLEMLTGLQYLRFVGRMYGLAEDVIDVRSAELFEKLDLAPGPKTVIADYSFGMKKKVALSAALIHGPEVLFLDEPFEGIDPVTSRTIKDILVGLSKRGTTLVLTSHILEIVERLCPTIAILEKGRLLGFGALDELKKGGPSLEHAFVEIVGGARAGELSWL